MGIKVIVFDMGDVMVDESGVKAREFIAKKYGFSEEDFWDYTKQNLDRSYRGKLSAEDFFKGLVNELGLEGIQFSDVVNDWLEIREKTSFEIPGLRDILLKLKGKYSLGVLSNSTILNEKVSVRKNCYDLFDFRILSCEVGLIKPEREIYELLINKTQHNPEEIVFVDDREENLVPARELGIKTVLFKDAEQLNDILRTLKVCPSGKSPSASAVS